MQQAEKQELVQLDKGYLALTIEPAEDLPGKQPRV